MVLTLRTSSQARGNLAVLATFGRLCRFPQRSSPPASPVFDMNRPLASRQTPSLSIHSIHPCRFASDANRSELSLPWKRIKTAKGPADSQLEQPVSQICQGQRITL